MLGLRRLCIALLVTLIGSFGLALTPAAAQARTEMSTAEASELYLSQACRINRALVRFSNAMFAGRDRVTAKQMRGDRLRRTKRAAYDVSTAYYGSARRLSNPPAEWPAQVAGLVHRMVEIDLVTSDRFDRLGASGGAQQVFRRYDRAYDAVDDGIKLSKRIRLGLNMPRNGC